jgi:hypothetical protein
MALPEQERDQPLGSVEAADQVVVLTPGALEEGAEMTEAAALEL